MTTAVYRSGTPTLALPQTQNTAPVLEFNCLYTHDIRRKQKRWQDGFLRFHTFNKRVMVYDIPRNFIGDTHWKADSELQDGDEVVLDKGGLMVQVTESVGRSETDLSELRSSRKKVPSDCHSSSPVRSAETPIARIVSGTRSTPTTQLKHRSLNALLGVPKGPIGKVALPTRSPFEQQHTEAENEDWGDGRPPKRQRTEPPAAWNITRTTRRAKPESKRELPLWARTVDLVKQKEKVPSQACQQRLGTKEIIVLSDDVEHPEKESFSSDALALPFPQPRKQAAAHQQPVVRFSPPAFQTQNPPVSEREKAIGKVKAKSPDAGPLVAQQRRARSPTGAMDLNEGLETSELPLLRAAGAKASQAQLIAAARMGYTRRETMGTLRPVSGKAGQTLRMTANAPKKKMLLCQDQLSKEQSRERSAKSGDAVDVLLDATTQHDVSTKGGSKSQRRQLEERLASIAKKDDSSRELDPLVGRKNAVIERSKLPVIQSDDSHGLRPQTPIEASALELAQLDQMIMPLETLRHPSPEAVSAREERQLRRVVSESNKPSSNKSKRIPGAPVRYTPSPAKRIPAPDTEVQPATLDPPGVPVPERMTAISPKPRIQKSMQRAVSLNTTSDGTTTVILSKPFQTPQPPEQKAVGPLKVADPWSREAFDLFEWRPPGWDEEKWCLQDGEGVRMSS